MWISPLIRHCLSMEYLSQFYTNLNWMPYAHQCHWKVCLLRLTGLLISHIWRGLSYNCSVHVVCDCSSSVGAGLGYTTRVIMIVVPLCVWSTWTVFDHSPYVLIAKAYHFQSAGMLADAVQWSSFGVLCPQKYTLRHQRQAGWSNIHARTHIQCKRAIHR